MSFNKLSNTFQDTLQKLLEVINAHLEYYQVVAFDKLVYLVSKTVSASILVGIGVMVTLFGSLALATFLAEVLGHDSLGFLIVAVLYGLAGWGIYSNREEWIVNPIIETLAEVVEDTTDDLGLQDTDEETENSSQTNS